MTYTLCIRGGTVVDPSSGVHGPRDVLLQADEIAAVIEPNGDAAATVVRERPIGCWR